jgi:hypothetical protein
MKDKRTTIHAGVQDLCRKLKDQLEELAVTIESTLPKEELARRTKLMEQLKQQLAELS